MKVVTINLGLPMRDVAEEQPKYHQITDAERKQWRTGHHAANPAQAQALVAELDDFESSFALYSKASMGLMDAYIAAHPDFPKNTWPDAGKVNAWALEQIKSIDFLVKAAAIMATHDGTVWRCSSCGEGLFPGEAPAPSWRFDGKAWEHKCEGLDPQAGYFPAREFK